MVCRTCTHARTQPTSVTHINQSPVLSAPFGTPSSSAACLAVSTPARSRQRLASQAQHPRGSRALSCQCPQQSAAFYTPRKRTESDNQSIRSVITNFYTTDSLQRRIFTIKASPSMGQVRRSRSRHMHAECFRLEPPVATGDTELDLLRRVTLSCRPPPSLSILLLFFFF